MLDIASYDFADERFAGRLATLACAGREGPVPAARWQYGVDGDELVITRDGAEVVRLGEATLRSLRDDETPHIVLTQLPDTPDDVSEIDPELRW